MRPETRHLGESLGSFLTAVDGDGIPFAGKAGYHLSLMHQAAGPGAAPADVETQAVGVRAAYTLHF